MDVFTAGWILWGLSFVGLEGYALYKRDPAGTLSDHVRELAGTNPNPTGPVVKLRRVALLGFMAWLTVHFLTNGSFM